MRGDAQRIPSSARLLSGVELLAVLGLIALIAAVTFLPLGYRHVETASLPGSVRQAAVVRVAAP